MHGTDDESALRTLRSAETEVEALRGGSLSPSATRGHILRVANAVDRSLRRLLRDDESAELSLRLKALAPDEIRIDSVLAELRRGERLSMEVAAAVHELLEMRRGLEPNVVPGAADGLKAVSAFDRLEAAIRLKPASDPGRASPGMEVPLATSGPAGELPPPAPQRPALRSRRRTSPPRWAFVVAALLVLFVLLAGWLVRNRAPDQMEQGIALFENGELEESAQYFWRFAEAHPDDPTPHLYLARIHRRLERPELAADAIDAAREIAPEDPAVHRELGFLLIETGQPEVAVDRFRTVIEREPESSEAWVGLVRALHESGRGDEVEAVLQEAPAEVRALLSIPAAD